MKSIHDFKYQDDYNKYLRTHFAGLAVQGILSNPSVSRQADGKAHTYTSLSELAINMADELLKQLENGKT